MTKGRPWNRMPGAARVLMLAGFIIGLAAPARAGTPSLLDGFNANVSGSYVYALALQADGKALIGGLFYSVNGIPRKNIARLNVDGSLDTTFNPGTGADRTVYGLVVQADGKVLLGGFFSAINGTACSHIARLNADGSLDASFNPGTGANNNVVALALQADGKVLLGGVFNSYNGTARNGIARLNPDGSLDTTFNPGTGANYTVNALAVQADGKVLLGGLFSTINGTVRKGIARLNADGSLNASFNPGTDGSVDVLAVQADGKLLLGGSFTTIGGVARNNIARLNPDGSLDTTFNPGTGASGDVYALAVQADGKLLLVGWFTTINGTAFNHIARLNADGSVDTTFNPGTGGSVRALAMQADGKVLLGGSFTTIGGVACNNIARLSNPDASRQALSVAVGGGSVTWALGGSYPQPYQALFEESADGTTWNTLGWGVAAPGVGYQFTGLSLPVKTNHYLRVTGWATGGESNGSASVYQSVQRFYVAPIRHTLTYRAGVNGSIDGATSVTQTVDRGTSGTTVMAVANAGYHFTGWSDGSTTNPRTDVNVTTNVTVIAGFVRQAALSSSKSSLRFLEGSPWAVDVERSGAPTTQILTLTNTGELPVSFTGGGAGTPGLALTGSCAADFSIASVTPATDQPLAPGASLTVVIRFAPQTQTRSLGLSAALEITTDSPLTPALTFSLLGDAVPVTLSSFSVE